MNGATSTVVVRAPRRTLDRPLSSLDRRDKPDWLRLGALVFMHAGCLAVLWVGWSWAAVGLAATALSLSCVWVDRLLSPLFFASSV